ncbi:hypothetical protein GGQ19_000709 [Salinibacter ruber]|uniref:hypothetical protein n=1 Tax=Salinibacter ruber TaxID=146919 RepID=UPI002168A797|nr:hypothetical protein [Salinibacter ruber]MCS3749558.1 hypothetical protein [Salinibacter ruber]
MDHSFTRRSTGIGLGVLLLLLVVLPACSDDPILGPSDGAPEEGGSYSTLDRLSPPATAVDSSQSSSKTDSTTTNPARF